MFDVGKPLWSIKIDQSNCNWSELWAPWSSNLKDISLTGGIACIYKSSIALHLLFWRWVLQCPSCERIHSISGISDGRHFTRLIEWQTFTLLLHLEACHTFQFLLPGLRVYFLRLESDEYNWANEFTLPLLITKLVQLLKNCTTATTGMRPVVATAITLHEFSYILVKDWGTEQGISEQDLIRKIGLMVQQQWSC